MAECEDRIATMNAQVDDVKAKVQDCMRDVERTRNARHEKEREVQELKTEDADERVASLYDWYSSFIPSNSFLSWLNRIYA